MKNNKKCCINCLYLKNSSIYEGKKVCMCRPLCDTGGIEIMIADNIDLESYVCNCWKIYSGRR